MSVPVVQLGELCEMDRQGLRPDDPFASGLPFVGVEHVESDSGAFNFNNGSRIGSQKSTTFRFDERHVLYAKLRPYLNKVATPGFAGRCSTELVPLLPRDGVDREFIAFLLRRQESVDYVNHIFRVRPHPEVVLTDYLRDVVGSAYGKTYFLSVAKRTTGIASVNKTQLGNFPVPVPPMELQALYAKIVATAHDIASVSKTAAGGVAALSSSLLSRLLESGP